MRTNIYSVQLVREKSVDYGGISSAVDAYELLKTIGLDKKSEEHFYVICLNAKGKIAGIHEVSHGEVTSCPVHPRDVFKRALLNNASSIIIAHNHPSGICEPSYEDRELTTRMEAAGKMIGIRLLDHLIVGDDSYFSFAGNGVLE